MFMHSSLKDAVWTFNDCNSFILFFPPILKSHVQMITPLPCLTAGTNVVHCDLTSSLCYHLFKRKLFQTSCASFRYKFANISCSAMFLVGRRGFLQKKLILRSLRFLKAKHPGLYEEFLRLLFKQH